MRSSSWPDNSGRWILWLAVGIAALAGLRGWAGDINLGDLWPRLIWAVVELVQKIFLKW
jgi:hypothetical protein